jgi:hypothetical protein
MVNEPYGANNRERNQKPAQRERIAEECASAAREGQIGAKLREAKADDNVGERLEAARKAVVILR